MSISQNGQFVRNTSERHYETEPLATSIPENVPHAGEVETAALGAFFQDKISIAIARDRFNLQPEDFYQPRNQIVYQAIFHEWEKGRAIDPVTISYLLERHGKLNEAGGWERLVEISEFKTNFANIETYLQDIKSAAAKRLLFQRGEKIRDLIAGGASLLEIQECFESTSRELATKTAEMGAAARARFQLIPANEYMNRPDPEFLVDGMIVEKSLVSIEGRSGCFKSFQTISLACSIATGLDWCGRKVQSGPVIYISGEGSGGLKARIQAWAIHNKQPIPPNLYILPEAVRMMDDEELAQLIASIKLLSIKPKLIVIDTLARCMTGGDENSTKDMSLFVAAGARLQNVFDCAVGVVHHWNRSGDLKGNNAFPNALDTRIAIVRNKDTITMKCEKQKDSEEFESLTLKKQIIYLDQTKTISSLVFNLSDESPADDAVDPETEPKAIKPNRNMETIFTMLLDSEYPLNNAQWLDLARAAGMSARTFYTHKNSLLTLKRVEEVRNKYIAVPTQPAFDNFTTPNP